MENIVFPVLLMVVNGSVFALYGSYVPRSEMINDVLFMHMG